MLPKVFFPLECINFPSGILLGHYHAEQDCYYVITIIISEEYGMFCDLSPTVTSKHHQCRPIGLWQSQPNQMKIVSSVCGIRCKKWPVLLQNYGKLSVFFIQPNMKQASAVNGVLSESCVLFLYKRQDVYDGHHLIPQIQKYQQSDQQNSDDTTKEISLKKQTFCNDQPNMCSFNNIADFEMLYFLYIKVASYTEKTDFKTSRFLFQSKAMNIFYKLSSIILGFWIFLSYTIESAERMLFSWCPCSHLVKKCLQLSSVGSQLVLKFELLSSLRSTNKIGNICRSNLILALLFDMFLGILFCYWLLSSNLHVKIYTVEVLMPSVDYIANQVEQLIKWLMGIPIGLKLNSPLNHFLGKFFLHHVQLWLDYLHVVLSIISTSLNKTDSIAWPIYLGCFGFSFFVAFFSDVISIFTFHIYCFYVYAARLYGLQVTGLMSFWRLFRGKKWNPLRNRVDTLPHSLDVADHRFYTGTLFFTMLLFLLPTTALYYIIFAVLRVTTMCLQVTLQWCQRLLTCFPWYTVILRIIRPCSFAVCAKFNQTNFEIDNSDWVEALRCPEHFRKVYIENISVLRMLLQVDSYYLAISRSLKEMNWVFSEPIRFREISTSLLSGKLLKWM